MPATKATHATPAPLIDVEKLFADPVFSRASISPDGTRLAYLAPHRGRTNVWVRGIDEDHTDAVCATHDSRRGIRTYYWTDNPRFLLYLQDNDGNEDWHLFRVDLDAPDGLAVDLTPMDPGSRVMGVEPMRARPGSVLVTMNRRPLCVDAFVIDIATGETTLHQQNDSTTTTYIFGPAGEAFFTATIGDLREYHAVDTATGTSRVIHVEYGVEHPLGQHPVQVTPDGTGLLIGTYLDSDDLQLVRIDIETGDKTVVAAMEGRSLCIAGYVSQGLPPTIFTSRRTGEVLAARFVGDRPTIKVVDPTFADVYDALSRLSDGVLMSASSDESERRWVATFTHDREPGLTYLYDHESGESRLLFRPYPQLDPADLAPVTGVSLTARDGLRLHAFLTLPVGVDQAGLPLVVKVHGGPWWHDSWGFDPEVQFLANRGYAVLQVNFRGSSGYGKRHITSAIGEFAGTMQDDLIDAANWAVEQGYADPKRIGIFGRSYGGYATLVGVTFTPDYFAAAVDYVGISSLPNFMRSLPEFVRPMMAHNFHLYCGDPDDPAQEAELLARSPITKVDQIRTPLLVIQGANDPRVVKAEADNIVEALTARGIPVDYLVADDEGHGFQNPENLMTMFRAVEHHFGEYLAGRTTAGPTTEGATR